MLAPLRPLESPSGEECGAGLPELLNLPASLCAGLRFTPEQFAALCQANPEAVLELAADGSLILMTPTGSDTGARNAELPFQIKTWARATGNWKAFDSSSGFRLPDNSVLSPDQRRGFAPLCPDLVVEQPVAMASPRTWCPSTGCFGAHDLEQHLAKRGLPQVRQAPIGILPPQRSHVYVGGGGQHQGVVKPGLRAGGTFAVRWESRLTSWSDQ